MPTIADYYVQIVPSAEGIGSELSNIMDSEAGAAGAAASGSFGSKFSSGLLKSNLGAQAIWSGKLHSPRYKPSWTQLR